ncbi:hypothetical protein FRC02_005745 [Tulasnella sp. 418]|nr:hypothetical protein FRC02_005745 [Tulasnella sp. 418]
MYYSDDSDIEIRSLSDDSEVSNSDESIRSASPAPSDSDESIYSLSSSVYGQRLRDYNGRLFNTIHEAYIMPSDEEEHVRHDIQHRCLSYAIGSLYASPERVRAALAPNPNYTPAIIDIGTGAGSWAIEMALEFPHAEVLGIDLAPPITHMPIPDNCRFEVDDCNLPLTHYMNSYNVAHLRSVEFGVRLTLADIES